MPVAFQNRRVDIQCGSGLRRLLHDRQASSVRGLDTRQGVDSAGMAVFLPMRHNWGSLPMTR